MNNAVSGEFFPLIKIPVYNNCQFQIGPSEKGFNPSLLNKRGLGVGDVNTFFYMSHAMNFPNATAYETMKGSQKQLWRQGAPLPFSLTIVSTKGNYNLWYC